MVTTKKMFIEDYKLVHRSSLDENQGTPFIQKKRPMQRLRLFGISIVIQFMLSVHCTIRYPNKLYTLLNVLSHLILFFTYYKMSNFNVKKAKERVNLSDEDKEIIKESSKSTKDDLKTMKKFFESGKIKYDFHL